jgi:KDO2-lipid IV(A) lauroyltransferase
VPTEVIRRGAKETRLSKRIKRLLRYYVLRGLLAAVAALPLDLAKRLGAWLGRLGFRLAGKERSRALASLEIAFPELQPEARAEIARRCFEHMGISAAEFCCSRSIAPRLSEYVELPAEDEAMLRAAVAEGHGVLFVTAHVGNFELMARRIGALGHPCCTVAEPSSDPRLTKLIQKMRLDGGFELVWRGQGKGAALHEMERRLAANHMVGVLIDQDTRVRGTFVDFFGRPAFTPKLPAELALRTGAAVVCGFDFRRPDGGHLVRLERIEPHSRTGDLEADGHALTQRLTNAIEQAIRRDPPAWSWNHRRWKTQPPGPQAAAEPARAKAV